MEFNFEIITDSCCNLKEHVIEEYGLHILPLTFMAEGKSKVYQSYLKGQTTDLSKFYEMMRNGEVFRTSLPSVIDIEKMFREVLSSGRDVLYIGFSSGLSGTFEATNSIANKLKKEFPNQKIYCVDTLAASLGEGLLVWHACQKAAQGASIESVRDWLEENKLKLAHWFTVDDLMFLWRGGRVSKTSAWAGTLLNIKPVLHVDNAGHLIPMEKVRGRKKSLSALLDHMQKTAIQPLSEQMVFIVHGDCEDEATWLENEIRNRFGVKNIMINCIDPVIGAHSGPGTMAVFFLASGR